MFLFLFLGVFRFGVCMIEAIACTQTEFLSVGRIQSLLEGGGLQRFYSNKTELDFEMLDFASIISNCA